MVNYHSSPNTYAGQVHLLVSDLEKSTAFYQHVIGFSILEKSEKQTVFSADGRTALLTLEKTDQVREQRKRTTGLYHFALLLPSRTDLGDMLVHLLETGWPLQGASDHAVSEAVYLADPEGNGIEIYRDLPSEQWRWEKDEVHMVTEPMDADGVLAARSGSSWRGLPAETVMGHIHLHVSDLSQTEEFYVQKLGFEVALRFGGQALFLSTGRYHHHIGVNTWAGIGAPRPEKDSPGLKWYTLVYPNAEALKIAVENLRNSGIRAEEETGSYLTEDPSGNQIRLVLE